MKDKTAIKTMIEKLKTLKSEGMYLDDFFLTWDKTDDELAAVFQVAEILRAMREANISPKVFSSGLGISNFRDNSTRTRFSFA
ncbi:MAG TPA: knotted carbamoyltransferase YgeW, partial [Sphaerochaeta sp.]|nr:knotted carbamoyltransferase YgeW [Sphaerochaeta sp.]